MFYSRGTNVGQAQKKDWYVLPSPYTGQPLSPLVSARRFPQSRAPKTTAFENNNNQNKRVQDFKSTHAPFVLGISQNSNRSPGPDRGSSASEGVGVTRLI